MSVGFSAFIPTIKVNRLPKNPLDKCTIVSVYPRKLVDRKPTMFPGYFEIEAAPDNDFSILVVGSSSWFREMEEGQPYLEIPISSIQVAEGFINDYINGLLGYTPEIAAPGLFVVPGEWTKKTIITYKSPEGKTFSELIEKARARQKRWFSEIVKLADTMWARTNGNPLSINDDARIAAEQLNLKDKPWLQDFRTIEKTNCRACGQLINPLFPVCPNCKAISDPEKAKALNISFAS
jgi:hypothetical protein